MPGDSAAGQLRSDAAVNAANALSSRGELVTGTQQLQLLEQAVQLYRMALSQEEDALVRSELSGGETAHTMYCCMAAYASPPGVSAWAH